MKGTILIKVTDSRVRYSFELVRNITVVQGNSGTGKTTLFEMIAAYARLKDRSGVQVVCEHPCTALFDEPNWQDQLKKINGSIVFIDEDAEYIGSHDFASAIRHTDNYYVIFSREPMHELPYSVDEIYEIRTSGKYHSFHKLYRPQKGRIFAKASECRKSDVVLTEDAASGHQFYQNYYEGSSVQCETAQSNSGIFGWLKAHHDQKVFIIADGAAFGSEMDRVMKLQHQYPDKITVCLPESFEWLILQSGLIQVPGLKEMIIDPSSIIDSKEYFSWENFFEEYLINHTVDSYFAYSKSKLHSFYTIRENSEKIIAVISANMPESNHVKA